MLWTRQPASWTGFKDEERYLTCLELCKAFPIRGLQALWLAKNWAGMGREWPGGGRSDSQKTTGKHLDVNQKELVRKILEGQFSEFKFRLLLKEKPYKCKRMRRSLAGREGERKFWQVLERTVSTWVGANSSHFRADDRALPSVGVAAGTSIAASRAALAGSLSAATYRAFEAKRAALTAPGRRGRWVGAGWVTSSLAIISFPLLQVLMLIALDTKVWETFINIISKRGEGMKK